MELVNTFQNINKIKIPYSFEERRNGDVARLVADNELLKKLLNWVPKRTLEEMCKDGWKWQLLNPDGYETKNNL
jgi:UDP-glucose 4-epimerase